MTVLINYLYNHCQGDPILKAVCNNLHGAIREFRLTSAQAASVAIVAQHCMVLDPSTFRDHRPLRAMLLSTPVISAAHGTLGPRASQQSQKRRAAPSSLFNALPPPLTSSPQTHPVKVQSHSTRPRCKLLRLAEIHNIV